MPDLPVRRGAALLLPSLGAICLSTLIGAEGVAPPAAPEPPPPAAAIGPPIDRPPARARSTERPGSVSTPAPRQAGPAPVAPAVESSPALALRRRARVEGPAAWPALAAAADGDDPDARHVAIAEMARIDDRAALPHLARAALLGEVDLRRRAVGLLGRSDRPEALGILAGLPPVTGHDPAALDEARALRALASHDLATASTALAILADRHDLAPETRQRIERMTNHLEEIDR